jgi:hypothetical protein
VHIPLTILIVLLAATLLLWLDVFGIFKNLFPESSKETGKAIKLLGTLAALVGSFWAFFVSISRSLLSGSASAAQSFLKFTSDPMSRLGKYFSRLIKKIKKPVAISIDDLDRCKPEYVVNLLEGIQTLFRNNRIIYIVAADRKWISTCFEKIYEEFADTVKTPGQRLGYLFVEKAFQLSTRVPALSQEDKGKYLDYLLAVKKEAEEEKETLHRANARELIKNEYSEDAILSKISEAEKGGNIPAHILREAAVEQLSNRRVQKLTEHSLQPFAKYLAPNPRAMKRLLNFYSVLREVTVLEGVNVERSPLVRWLILTMRWPMLGEYLEEYPEHINYFPKPGDKQEKLEIPKNFLFDDELQKLYSDKEVLLVVHGEEKEHSVNAETIRQCQGLI